jgi:hypothetical protein
MMNRKTLWWVAAALLLPILARLIWFFPGFAFQPKVATPDYQSLSVPVPPIETASDTDAVASGAGVVVFDTQHGNAFRRDEIGPLTAALTERGARVEFDDATAPLAARLKYASAYVVISPNLDFAAAEVALVNAFVARGGRLVVFTDATRGQLMTDFFTGNTTSFPDVNAANLLLAPFGLTVNNDYLYNLSENEGNFRNVFFSDFGKHDLSIGLQRVALYGSHSVGSESGTILLAGSADTLSSQTDAVAARAGGAALDADGRVLALGDFTFLTVPYIDVADNRELAGNIADFMLAGERQTGLADFPYIFSSRSVHVLATSNVQMTAELVGALSRVQAALRPFNVGLQVVDQTRLSGDLMVLGTYAPSDDLLAFIEPFDLVLDEFAEFVESPVFGKVGRAGNGMLLFERDPDGNRLILLADTGADLAVLLDSLTAGELTGCLIQGEAGVCSIGFGGSFSEEPAFDFGFELTPTFPFAEGLPPELQPTPTPPGG